MSDSNIKLYGELESGIPGGFVTDVSKVRGAASAVIVPATYSELKTLKTKGELIPGRYYRITDYMTQCYQQPLYYRDREYMIEVVSAQHQFDLIVRANTNSSFDPNAQAALHDGDDYFADSALHLWEIKYCFDNDENYNWVQNKTGYYIHDKSEYIWEKTAETEIINGATYNIAKNSGLSDIFARLYVKSNVFSLETAYFKDEDGNLVSLQEHGIDEAFIHEITQEFIDSYKGVIYFMKDENYNEAHYDFKNIKHNKLVDSEFVKAGSYFTFTNTERNDKSIHHTYGVCVNNKIVTLYNYDIPCIFFVDGPGGPRQFFHNTIKGYNIIFSTNCYGNTILVGDNSQFSANIQYNYIKTCIQLKMYQGCWMNNIDYLDNAIIDSYAKGCNFIGHNKNVVFKRYGNNVYTGGFNNITVRNCHNITLRTSNSKQYYTNYMCNVTLESIGLDKNIEYDIVIPKLNNDGAFSYIVDTDENDNLVIRDLLEHKLPEVQQLSLTMTDELGIPVSSETSQLLWSDIAVPANTELILRVTFNIYRSTTQNNLAFVNVMNENGALASAVGVIPAITASSTIYPTTTVSLRHYFKEAETVSIRVASSATCYISNYAAVYGGTDDNATSLTLITNK